MLKREQGLRLACKVSSVIKEIAINAWDWCEHILFELFLCVLNLDLEQCLLGELSQVKVIVLAVKILFNNLLVAIGRAEGQMTQQHPSTVLLCYRKFLRVSVSFQANLVELEHGSVDELHSAFK